MSNIDFKAKLCPPGELRIMFKISLELAEIIFLVSVFPICFSKSAMISFLLPNALRTDDGNLVFVARQ